MTDWSTMAAFIIGFISSTLAGFFVPWWGHKIQSARNYIYFRVFPSTIDLSGEWKADFQEPENDGTLLESSEAVTLTQKGSTLKGGGTTGGKYTRKFKFSGEIIQNVFRGTYERVGEKRGVLIGTGVFELAVSADRQTMVGKCIWLDKYTSQIECSDYKWSRAIR